MKLGKTRLKRNHYLLPKITQARLTLMTVLISSSNLRCMKKSQWTKGLKLTRLQRTVSPKSRLYLTKHRLGKIEKKTRLQNRSTIRQPRMITQYINLSIKKNVVRIIQMVLLSRFRIIRVTWLPRKV